MGSIFSTARPSLVGSWHPVYVNYLGAQNSRSPACTLAFYFLMHFVCCSLHFFEDVCITNYKQGVKGGMNFMLTSNYKKYISHMKIHVYIHPIFLLESEPTNVLIWALCIILCVFFKTGEMFYIWHQGSSSEEKLFLC